MYLAWHAIKNIFDIDRQKELDRLKNIEKRLRKGLPAYAEKIAVIVESEVKKKSTKKKSLEEEVVIVRPTCEDPDSFEHYGRYWVFVNYFSEEADSMKMWRKGVDSLRRVNPAVIEDIDDHILL